MTPVPDDDDDDGILHRTREELKASGVKKEEKVTVQHVEDGWTARYKVVEDPKTMKKEDWARVVAMFVQVGPLDHRMPLPQGREMCLFRASARASSSVKGGRVGISPCAPTFAVCLFEGTRVPSTGNRRCCCVS